MSRLASLFTTMTHELKHFSAQTSEILYNDTISCSEIARSHASGTGHLDRELHAWFKWPKQPPDWQSPEGRAFLAQWNRLYDEDPTVSDDFIELDRYLCTDEYRAVQAALRNQHTTPLSPDHQALVEGASRALRMVPKFRGPVVRHVHDLPPEVLARYQKGRDVTEDAFTSTTRNLDGVPVHRNRADVEMRIESKTGSDMRYIPLVIRGDDEVLFPPGTPFHVTDRYLDKKTGLTIIEMVEKT